MASPLDQARLLLLKAKDDWVALQILFDNRQVADEIIGFHAQQVIEKSIKAVLCQNSIVFRWTHDLTELIDLLKDNGIQTLPALEKAVELTPFAVEFRYDFLPPEVENAEHLERGDLRILVREILEWANSMIPQISHDGI